VKGLCAGEQREVCPSLPIRREEIKARKVSSFQIEKIAKEFSRFQRGLAGVGIFAFDAGDLSGFNGDFESSLRWPSEIAVGWSGGRGARRPKNRCVFSMEPASAGLGSFTEGCKALSALIRLLVQR